MNLGGTSRTETTWGRTASVQSPKRSELHHKRGSKKAWRKKRRKNYDAMIKSSERPGLTLKITEFSVFFVLVFPRKFLGRDYILPSFRFLWSLLDEHRWQHHFQSSRMYKILCRERDTNARRTTCDILEYVQDIPMAPPKSFNCFKWPPICSKQVKCGDEAMLWRRQPFLCLLLLWSTCYRAVVSK